MTITVLLVDDQELFRRGLETIINAQPEFDVIGTAANGHEAVRLAAERKPDVIFMDIRMPVMDGVAATEAILRDRVGDRPRVIVLTTFNLDDRAAAAIRLGASGFLLKDTTPEQLYAAIHTVDAGTAVIAPDDLAALMAQQFPDKSPIPPSFGELTAKEREIFAAAARGWSNREIAASVWLSESTVKTHIGAILRKLTLRDRVQLVVFAHQHGLVEE